MFIVQRAILFKDQLLAVITEMIESEPIDYQEMSKEETISFITENYDSIYH